MATWYGQKFHGLLTANGERFDRHAFTAAHRRFPLGSIVLVTHLRNRKSVVVRINDRGPWLPNRDLDLSQAAAAALGMEQQGLARVRLDLLYPALPN
jgi:rare lipoprotein A